MCFFVFVACSVWCDFANGFVPLRKGVIVEYNEESFRACGCSWCPDSADWKVELKCEKNVGPDYVLVESKKLRIDYNYSWTSFNDNFFFFAQNKIPQLDGDNDNGEVNSGEVLRKFVSRFDENETIIKETVDKIINDGIDADGIEQCNRFDAFGFASKARNAS